MKRFIELILLVVIFIPVSLAARDINLDEIYIKKSSIYFKRLTLEKLEAYRKIGAVFVDRNVIFAGWISGNELIYIKEIDSSNTNFIYKYTLIDRKAIELCRVHGVITVANVTPGGRYIVIKRLLQTTSIIPKGERIIVDIKSGSIAVRASSYAFLDFSIPQEGNSIIFEKDNGIVEASLDTEIQSELLKKKYYQDIVISSSPTLAFFSPDRQKIIVANGSGGNYKAKLIWGGKSSALKGITSSSEIFWLDNFTIAYRTGYAGNYSVMLRNIKNNTEATLLKKSFNTNIIYSVHSEMLSFLNEQIIIFYDKTCNKKMNTGIEGEDISFAPNRSKFISLLYKKLFIANVASIEKKYIELNRSWNSIISIYKDLKNKKSEYENEYSQSYIDRKIQVYSELSGI